MAAGYSGTPLVKKLGLQPSMKIFLLHPPEHYFRLLEYDASGQMIKKKEVPDFIHFFAGSISVFETGMNKILAFAAINRNIIIWISWYKKTAGKKTDLDENIIRNYALAHDLVDIKVCAVDEEWSGLKLVVPKALR